MIGCTKEAKSVANIYKTRAVAGRTTQCRCKFWYASKFTTASCGFCYSTAFLYRPTSATIQMLKLNKVCRFHGRDTKSWW